MLTSSDNESDGQLARRFAEGRDEVAFAKLVERRGALVQGVCVRMLRHREDAEDAFQAVFLVLARRAHALRHAPSLAGWLHGVAMRVCLNQRKADRRRQQRIQEVAGMAREAGRPDRLEELKLVIDEELAAIPQRYREVLILCDLEDCARDEVSRTLRLPTGTVSSRLARGRELMRRRLTRRGLSVAAGGMASCLTKCSEAALTVSAELVHTTVRNARIYRFGTAATKTELRNKIVSLAEGVLQVMIRSQWKTAVCLVALLATTLFGTGVVPTLIPSLLNAASADTILYDNFNDGEFADGTPANWFAHGGFNRGTFSAASGDLVLTPESAGDVQILLPEGIRPGDVSMRTRVRFTDNADGPVDDVGFFARIAGSTAYGAGIDTSGLLYISYTTPNAPFTDLSNLPTDFRTDEQDLFLQFDVFGDKLSLFAWRPGEAKPTEPQVQATDTRLQEGEVAIFSNPRTLDSATFRFVQITDDASEPIPEPEANILATLSGVLVLGGMFFGRRRVRRKAPN